MADNSSGKSTPTNEKKSFQFYLTSENMIQIINLLWKFKEAPQKNSQYELKIVAVGERNVTDKQTRLETDCENCIWEKQKEKINELMGKVEKNDAKNDQEDLEKTKNINLLVIGEDGTGKTTFINGLANYIKYESIDDVKRQGLIVKLSTSYSVFSDNENERIELCGEEAEQEDITECTLNYENIVLKVIDTPGLKGLDTDQGDLQKIKDYVTKNPIDAVIWLFKPNESEYNFFDQFFNIITLVNPKVYFFGFTHTRQTSFRPGKTFSLLRKQLEQRDVDYEMKGHTFTYEHEWFRGLSYGTETKELQDEFKQSWAHSQKEFVRMMTFLKNYY